MRTVLLIRSPVIGRLELLQTRDLQLSAVMRIHLPTRKGDRQEPDQQVLQLQDHSMVLEGRDIEDIAAQLPQRYPDETHERFLRQERDFEIEQRNEAAMEMLIEFLAKAAVNKLLRERKGGSRDLETEQS